MILLLSIMHWKKKVLSLTIVSTRKNFDDIVDVMLWQDSSDDSSSSEDDLDELLLEFVSTKKRCKLPPY